jgi:hypothetical protein
MVDKKAFGHRESSSISVAESCTSLDRPRISAGERALSHTQSSLARKRRSWLAVEKRPFDMLRDPLDGVHLELLCDTRRMNV